MQKSFAIGLIVLFIVVEIICGALVCVSLVFPLKYHEEIKKYSEIYNIEESKIASFINTESGFNKNKVSSKGAVGLMQIIPSTARYISSLYDIDLDDINELFIPEKNIEIGTAYLNYLSKKFEDENLISASYNAGETKVRSWLKNESNSIDGKTLNNIPYIETKNYVKKINLANKIYSKFYKI